MTAQTAKIKAHNSTGATYCIRLYHYNADYGVETYSWILGGYQVSSDYMTVHFDTGLGSLMVPDDWWVSMSPISDASNATWYASSADPRNPPEWDKNQLQSSDAGQTLTFQFNQGTYTVNLDSGSKTFSLTNLGGKMTHSGFNFTNVFVLMLENHSFDNILAFSGIPGIQAATAHDSNTYNNGSKTLSFNVEYPAPTSMPTDPGHEFLDVVEQLGGQGAQYSAGKYPTVNNSGFAANYATSTTEETGLPDANQVQDVMACFNTSTQLPVTFQLARKFAVCDQWFSSMPGPTWPNRYFVHCASSSGLDDSPSDTQMSEWEAWGLSFPNGSIFDKFNKLSSGNWRIYHDHTGPEIGEIPQVTSINNVGFSSVESLDNFASDLNYPYPYRYTFIEPNYGDTYNNTYAGGTSQHPMDGVSGGEGLIKRVYEAIRNSPLWNESLLIITYDEHGGFYDSVPPGSCTAPGDDPKNSLNKHGFDFTLYGVRVPAIIVSPRIPIETVDHTVYDHSSVVRTLTNWVGINSLTNRDGAANDLASLLSISPRSDCPTKLPNPVADSTPSPAPSAEAVASLDAEPLPPQGNHWGFLAIAAKMEYELSSKTPEEAARIKANLMSIKTRGHAREYTLWIKRRAELVKAAKKAAAATSVQTQN